MSVSFTPGPWTLVSDPFENGIPYFKIEAGDGFHGSEDKGFGLSGIISEANAHLIAAAPELYAAIYATPLPSTMGNVETHYQQFYDWYNKVAAPALAKARGES